MGKGEDKIVCLYTSTLRRLVQEAAKNVGVDTHIYNGDMFVRMEFNKLLRRYMACQPDGDHYKFEMEDGKDG